MINDYKAQIQYIRDLAIQLNQVVLTEANNTKRQRWADHNDLKSRQKPLLWVCIDDDGGWLELLPLSSLQCEDKDLRELELKICKYLYHANHLKDDFVFENKVYFDYPGEYTGYQYGTKEQSTAWGIEVIKPKVGENAYHLNNFLKTDKDYELLLHHEVDFIPDETEKKRLKDLYDEVLKDLLSVEFHLPYSVLVQSHLIELVHLRGLEELMYDLYDDDRLYEVIRHMAISKGKLLTRLEEKNLLFDNRINIYTGSGGLGYSNSPLKAAKDVKIKDMWGFADAQEFSNVSPSMFEKFALENQKIGLNMFGNSCYGCCEPLDHKYDMIFKHIKNIRRLSISPWSNIEMAVDNIKQKAILSWKANPIEICTGFDEQKTFKWLKETAQLTKDCYVEIILKDIRTCHGTNKYLVKFIELVNQAFDLD